MTPEKNNSVKKEVNKNKPTIANTLLKVGVSASMLLGASDCVVPPETTIETPQAGKTAPLPGDFTKTAESATDVNYEFTPTVANPSTQELTSKFSTKMEEVVDYEWIDSLLDKLGDEYYYNNKYPSIWFKKDNHDGTSEKSVPVLIFDFKNRVTFQEGVEGGRETVRYANYENVKVSSDGNLSLVDNYYKKNYSFSEVNMSWWEKSE